MLNNLLNRQTVIAAFNKVAERYNEVAVLQREIADRMFDRLEMVRIQPQVIIDAGARTGYTSGLLKQHYPDADIIAIDWAENLLRQVNPASAKICAEPDRLPLQSQIADLIVANLTWHWVEDKSACLREWRRLLKPGGMVLFTTLGPDTLQELRASFAAVDDYPHVHLFLDMHDIGDAMMAAQFSEPVMQADYLYLAYSAIDGLWRDLRGTGVTNALNDRRRGLFGKKRWQKMLENYAGFSTPQLGFPATFEVIYGLGWVADDALNYLDNQGDVVVPITAIKRSQHA